MTDFVPVLFDWMNERGLPEIPTTCPPDVIADILHEPFLGLRVATERPLTAHEDLVVAAKRRATLAAALRVIAGAQMVVGASTVSLIQCHRGASPAGRQANEFWVALLVQFAREATGASIVPSSVQLAHAAPFDSSALSGFLGTSHIHYLARWNAISFPRSVADLPVYALESAPRSRPLRSVADVRAAIREAFARGEPPTARSLALHLQISPRLLQQRLFEWSTSVRLEIDAVRRELADAYMRDAGISTQEIAVRLGYPAPRALEKAFVRWRGMTIDQYRHAV